MRADPQAMAHGKPEESARPRASERPRSSETPAAPKDPSVSGSPKAPSRPRRLRGAVFRSLLGVSLLVLAAFALAASLLFYRAFESDAEATLVQKAAESAARLDAAADQAERQAILRDQLGGVTRFTYLSAEGEVLYDSRAAGPLPSHADRPEFIEAERTGASSAIRHSATLRTDQIYAAARLADGSVIRVSQERRTFASYLAGLAGPIAGIVALLAGVVFVASRIISRRLIAPVNSVRLDEPLSSVTYEEMHPLLERIDEQQRRNARQREALLRAENIRREFSANVSHEMKTPLTVISGYAELLMNDLVKPEDRQRFAGLIYTESRNMRTLIDDVLIISRMEEAADGSRSFERVNLLEAAASAIARLSPAADVAGVRIVPELAPAPILGMRTYSEQMAYNLIDNAIRHARGGEVRISTWSAAGRSFLRVSDDGPGIPEELREKVFERFFRVDASHSKATGGTGLGLAIVKHAATYQDGTVALTESETGGACFTASFPSAG